MVKYYKVFGNKNKLEPTTLWRIFDDPKKFPEVYRPQDGGWVASRSLRPRFIMGVPDYAELIFIEEANKIEKSLKMKYEEL